MSAWKQREIEDQERERAAKEKEAKARDIAERKAKVEREKAEREAREKHIKEGRDAAAKEFSSKLKEIEEREKKLKADLDAAKKDAREAREAAEAEPEATGLHGQANELLQAGGFTRRLTWSERIKLRRIERATDRLRKRIEQTFGSETESTFVMHALDGLAHVDVVARLELLRVPREHNKAEA